MFRYGSPFMRLMTLVANLIILNMLWLLTSLPLVTMGASTSAMYYVAFKYAGKQDDSVIKPYFRAFKENFKQATLLWIPHSLIGLMLAAELFYLSRSETATIWWIIFGILTALYLLISAMLYPMLARYENTTRSIIINSINLTFRNLFPMMCAVILNVTPLVLCLLFPDVFWRTLGMLWVFGGFALIAYLNSSILLKIFQKYEKPEVQEQ